jgi:CRISPR-associated protein Csx10
MTETTVILHQLPIEITPHSPLAFAERKPGAQFRESLPYVPGTTIFGALGQLLAERENFDEALLRRIRCHNAYPANTDDTAVRPLPLTALQLKGESKQPMTDALVERVCWERQQPPALIYLPTDKDGRPWEKPGWRFYALQNGAIAERRVSQRVLTRVAINRRRGTAEDQRLYSPLALVEVSYDKNRQEQRTRFVGSLSIEDQDQANLSDWLQKITHLGGRQTTGLGRVTITPRTATGGAGIEQRVAQLTTRFQQQAALYAQWGGARWDIPDRTIFTVNLLSDAILLKDGWLPTQALSATMLKELTGIDAILLRAFTTTLTVGGWATLWQRPKATALAVGMGSVYLFQSKQPLTTAEYLQLELLQLDGIGERRQEGYGQIRICDEFHLPTNGNIWEAHDE